MLDLQKLGQMTEEEREAEFKKHAEETVAETKKPQQSIGGLMVRMMIEAAQRGER